MVKKIGDRKEEGIDFGKSRIGPLFDSIFFPTLLSMVFASLFTVADGIFVGQNMLRTTACTRPITMRKVRASLKEP